MDYRYIHAEIDQGLLTVTMDNPATMNGMDLDLGPELAHALEAASGDPAVRAVVLTGANGVFSAGGNLKAAAAHVTEHPGQGAGKVFQAYAIWVNRVAQALNRLDKPLVAAVHGAASGAGLGWLLLSDLAVVDEQAKLVCGFLRVGLAPGAAISLTLTQLMGRMRASEALLLNRPITPAEALSLGLAQRLAAKDEVLPVAQAEARALAEGPSRAMAATKRLLRRAYLEDLDAQVEAERGAVMRAADDPEFERRVKAFINRK